MSNLSGLEGTGSCCASAPLVKSSGVFDYADNLSWSRGKHQIKFGTDIIQIRPRTFATLNGRAALTSNPPFFGYGSTTLSSNRLNPATGFVLSPTATVARPNPIPASSYTLVPTATAALVSWPTHFKIPYVQQWSLNVQKQLPWGVLAKVNYVGNHGSQVLGVGQGNQPTVLNNTPSTRDNRPPRTRLRLSRRWAIGTRASMRGFRQSLKSATTRGTPSSTHSRTDTHSIFKIRLSIYATAAARVTRYRTTTTER